MAIISSGIYPINPNITDGTQLAGYINELVAAINSQQLSNTRPPVIAKGGVWSKQVSDTEIAVMLYDGTQDVQIASIVGGESNSNGGGGGEDVTLESLLIPNHDQIAVDESGNVTIDGTLSHATDGEYATKAYVDVYDFTNLAALPD